MTARDYLQHGMQAQDMQLSFMSMQFCMIENMEGRTKCDNRICSTDAVAIMGPRAKGRGPKPYKGAIDNVYTG